MDCSPPGFSVYRISQGRILEWIASFFSRGSSWPRDWTQVSCIGSRVFTTESLGKPELLLFFNFYWRLTTLQYCSCFDIHWHESAMGVHVFPILNPLPTPSPSHPSGSSQCTSPEHPISCIEPGLVICFTYDNIHVSVLFSQIIPPSPSPTESKRLFYTSVSLLLSRFYVYHYHLSKFHIYIR